MNLGWKWWVKTYFKVMFSREIWFSWFYIVLGGLMFMGLFDCERPVIVQASMCVAVLVVYAALLSALGMVQAILTLRQRRRIEAETATRMAWASSERLQSSIQATPPEPKQSPWFLGAWAEFLDKEEKGK